MKKKIIILSYFPKYSALWWWGAYLNQELVKLDNFDVNFIDLWDSLSHNPFIRLFHLFAYKLSLSSDIIISISPLLSKITHNSIASEKIIIEYDLYPLVSTPSLTNKLIKILYSYSLKMDKIISISEFSAKEFRNYYKIDSPPKVIYGGIDHDNYFPGINKNQFNWNNLTFLHIGRSDKRKNIIFLLKLMTKIKGSKLIKIGKFSKEELIYIKNNKLNVEIKTNLDSLEIRDLCLESDFLLFPSTYEGFGLPPVEAMACGCLTLVGDNTALKESCFDECRLALDLELWESRIKEICADKSLQKSLKEKGLTHCSQFRWDKYTTNLINTI